MHSNATSIFIVPNATFIAELVAFVIILAVLWRYVVPPLQKAMRERQDTIRRQLEESQRAKEQLASAEEEHRRTLAEARAEATQIREDAKRESQKIIDETKAKAQAEVDRIQQRGEEQLAAQRRQVISELRVEIGQMSVQLAGRVLGESLEEDARRRGTVDRFLNELDGMSSRSDSETVGQR
ncbi:MAG TPA: F0F1 ATP synthase subunit B [Mycobacteriales bacterium]|jgi:F-type H+-transporting ATPase subunit b|nr:F0F1 ATP synthase subunit B [Mycobacteriales bacterium]